MPLRLFFFICLLSIGLTSCNTESTPQTTKGTGDFSAYDLEGIPGTEMLKAVKYSASDILEETGYVLNDRKTGTWITYYPNGRIRFLKNYAAGELDGVDLALNNRGQIESKTSYRNGALEGVTATYRFGRPQEEYMYTGGRLNGISRKYYMNGKLREEISYRNDQIDGFYRYYGEDGVKTMEYVYKDGVKQSGGIVEPEAEQ